MAGALLRSAFGVMFVGVISTVLSISYVIIIYTGDLAPYLGRGIGLTLLGSALIAGIGAFCVARHGTVVHIQDAPAILLSGGVAAILAQGQLAGEALFATTAALISLTTLATGVIAVTVGRLKLALMARFIPYPVLAGFLAATGLLLCQGGLGVALGANDALTPADLLEPHYIFKWAPALVAGGLILALTQVLRWQPTLPLALIATGLGFAAMIVAMDLSLSEAHAQGLLLGPFQDSGFFAGLEPALFTQINWAVIASQIPMMATVVAISLVALTLNTSGLELAYNEDLDLNSEVQGAGLSNILGALVGGLPGYHKISLTLLAQKLQLGGVLGGLACSLGCVAILLLGANMLSYLPVGLFAAVITFLGLDQLYTWLWSKRSSLSLLDYAIVIIIPIAAIFISFLAAIGVGLLVAFGLFVVSYARLETIRSHNNISERRSFVERSYTFGQHLAKQGHRAHYIELTGYLFFGSANALREQVRGLLGDPNTPLDWLVVDFKHVSGMDVSTVQMIQRVQSDCAKRGVTLVISGTRAPLAAALAPVLNDESTLHFATLDAALEHVEDALLAQLDNSDDTALFGQIQELLSHKDLAALSDEITLQSGEALVKAGSRSDEIYVLRTGRLLVSVGQAPGRVVAKIRPGAIVGEMSYYAMGERTADVIAETKAQLIRIDAGRLDALGAKNAEVAALFHKAMAGHLSTRLVRTTTLLRHLEA